MTFRKKLGWSFIILLAVAAIGLFTLGPKMAEESMNKIVDAKLPAISEEAKALHKTLTIIDLHSDTLLWSRDMNDGASRGHMDVQRMQDGNLALQIFSSVTKTPKNQNYDSNSADGDNITPLVIAQLQPISTWGSIFERGLFHANKMKRAAKNSDGALRAIATTDGINTLMNDRKTGSTAMGAIFSAEGLHSLEGKRENLDKLYNAGMRMAGLTHFFDNELAGSMHGEQKNGMTKFGREIMTAMEDKGIIVDIAHCSHACVAEVLKVARRPVVSSHGGVQATCNVNRNLTDTEIQGVAATGGIIGVGYWEGAVCDTHPAAIAKAMKHIRDLVGIEHVALGSDYDGAVTVGFDTSGLINVTQALITAGFSETEIRAIMGGNALRVIANGLLPMAQWQQKATEENTTQNTTKEDNKA